MGRSVQHWSSPLVCFALDHLYSERFRIWVSLELTQAGLPSGIKTQSVSRELFDLYWDLSIVRLVPARGDWRQPQAQKALGKPSL